jgi:hypothetical protein
MRSSRSSDPKAQDSAAAGLATEWRHARKITDDQR